MVLDTKRLVNVEGISDHTALLPTKNKALVDFDELDISDNAKKVLALVYKNSLSFSLGDMTFCVYVVLPHKV